MPNQVFVNQFSANSPSDGNYLYQAGGKQSEALVSEVHGKYYTGAYRGKVFTANNGIAGAVIPVITSTTAQTAISLYNPLGSGINVELIELVVATTVTTSTGVIGSIGFGVLENLGAGVALPTSQVAATNIIGSPMSGGAPLPTAKALNTVTIVAATVFISVALQWGLTTAQAGPSNTGIYRPDGTMILGPGTLWALQGTVAQSSSFIQQITWAEWPI
jgi:hypothetical protein